MRTQGTRFRLPRPLAAVAGAIMLGVLLAGCENGGPMAPTVRGDRSQGASHAISVLTWNMYVGTDVDAALAALQDDPSQAELMSAIQDALGTLQETDVYARAAAIADQVAKARPHLLGFEEVSSIHVHLAPLGGPTVDLDFLPILRRALARRGLHYDVAVVGPGIQVSMLSGLIDLSDHDVLLFDRDRVSVLSREQHAFTARLPTVSTPYGDIDLTRGWVQARVQVDGLQYTVVDTHPESDQEGYPSFDALRQAQLGELLGHLGSASPVILMGDFNGLPGSGMYDLVTGTSAGFTDAWHAMRPGADGYTCCHLPDLSDTAGALDHRIDYIFTRGLGRTGPGLQGTIDRLGEVPSDRVRGPDYLIWPSDHAGLVGTFLSTPATVR